MSYQKTTGPLMANSHPGSYCGQDAYSDMLITENRGGYYMDSRERTTASDTSAKDSRSLEHDARSADSADTHYVARRLTPTECARLQGFPDDWAADVPHTDSAEYKMWGNGIALPCLLPMFHSLNDVYRKEMKP